MPTKTIRKNISTAIMRSFILSEGLTPTALADAAGVPVAAVTQALTAGVVDAADLVEICRVLDLDAGAVISDAANHTPEPVRS